MRAGGLSTKAGSRPPRHTSAGLYPCNASNVSRPSPQASVCKKAWQLETLTGAWADGIGADTPGRSVLSVLGKQAAVPAPNSSRGGVRRSAVTGSSGLPGIAALVGPTARRTTRTCQTCGSLLRRRVGGDDRLSTFARSGGRRTGLNVYGRRNYAPARESQAAFTDCPSTSTVTSPPAKGTPTFRRPVLSSTRRTTPA